MNNAEASQDPVQPEQADSPESLYRVVDFGALEAVNCPCGQARRAFADDDRFPGTLHVTEISKQAKRHFHRRLTETYFILECEEDAGMELNDDFVAIRPGMAILIPPGTIHRAVGEMKVLIVVHPAFDPADEFVVEDA